MTLAFDRDFDISYRQCDEVAPGLRRVVAENPTAFTFRGTGTYILGHGEVAIIDPGPARDDHVEALLRAVGGETVTHLLITHTHSDHSPASRALQERTGAVVYGFGPHPWHDPTEFDDEIDARDDTEAGRPHHERDHDRDESANGEPTASRPMEAPGDLAFEPDVIVGHGDIIEGSGWTVEALHTPGHISNHLCFAVPTHDVLFSGDHVMGWSTSVISPPAGDVDAYLASLELLLTLPAVPYWPTHGPRIANPHDYVRALHAHRLERTRQILDVLATRPRQIPEIVSELYVGLDAALVKAAGRSVLAHLISLVASGAVTFESPTGLDHPTAGAIFRRADA